MFVFIKALDQIMNDLLFNYCRKSTTVLRLGQSHFVLSELLEFLCCVGQHLPSRELIINLVATTEVRLVSFHILGCIYSGSELCCLLSTFNETTDAFLKKDDPSSTCAIVESNLLPVRYVHVTPLIHSCNYCLLLWRHPLPQPPPHVLLMLFI